MRINFHDLIGNLSKNRGLWRKINVDRMRNHVIQDLVISFGFILLHLIFTQLYLWTSTGNKLLFPEAVETNQPVDNSKEESTQQPEQLERRKTKWIILIVSIAITVGLFCYVGIILTQGKKNLSDSTTTKYLAA